MTQSLLDRINAIQNSKNSKESKDSKNDENKQLITIEPSSALEIFTDEKKIKELLFSAVQKTKTLVPDVETEKGRKDIASMAYSVARTKTYLDSIGKELVSHYKEIPKKIDSTRKFARDSLDLLRDEVRKPLDDWESEQARLKLIEEIADCHIIALHMNTSFDDAKKLRLEKEEQEREAIKKAIQEEAERQAEIKIKAEREALEEKHRLDLIKAEENRLEQIAKAELDKQQALEAEQRREEEHQKALKQAEENRKIAIAKAEIEKAEAVNAEKQRAIEQQKAIEDKRREEETQKEMALKRLEAEIEEKEKKRITNEAHQKRIHAKILVDIITETQLQDEAGIQLVAAIVSGKIRHLSISY